MYLRGHAGIGQEFEQRFLAQGAPISPEEAKFQGILTSIESQLRRRFTGPNDPRLSDRRQKLRELFSMVPPSYVDTLFQTLGGRMTADPLSRLFHSRLATATRNEMLAILNCKGFLKEYELGFNPDPVTFGIDNNPDPNMTASKKIDRKKDVRDLIPRLQDRLRARAATALNPLVPTPLPAFPSLLNTTVQRLADAQLSLFRKWFPDGRGGIRFLSFQRCFEQFANGELRDPSVIGHPGFGEPDSDAYFFFAEFAFLCIELGFNKSLWRQALRTFVKTQEIFMHVYRETPALRPPRVNARLPDPGPARPTRFFDFSNFQAIGPSVTMGKGQSDRNRKVVLRAKYDGMSESALKAAMRDNLLRALRMP